MDHTCKSLILHCIDFRFGKAIKQYLEEKNLLGNCDIVSVAGAAKNIASPAKESDQEFVLRQIDISKKLHDIKEVILMNHADCGAYGGHKAFQSDEAEHEAHVADMRKSKQTILNLYPNVNVKITLATISPENKIGFEEIE